MQRATEHGRRAAQVTADELGGPGRGGGVGQRPGEGSRAGERRGVLEHVEVRRREQVAKVELGAERVGQPGGGSIGSLAVDCPPSM